jgi:hypothetical protein
MSEAVYIRGIGQGPETLDVRWPNTNTPVGQPLPAGSTVSTQLIENEDGWDPNQAVNFLVQADAAASQLSRIGVQLPNGIDFGRAAASIASGAALGSVVPGVGTVAGAAIGLGLYVVEFIQASGAGLGPYPDQQTAWWAQAFAEQAFVDWAVEHETNTWGSIQDMARAQLLFWLERWKCVLVAYPETGPGANLRGASFYNSVPDLLYLGYAGGEAAVRDLYKQAGVDYDATRQARIEANTTDYKLVAQYRIKLDVPGGVVPGRTPQEPPRGGGADTKSSLGVGALAAGAVVLYLLSQNK